MASVPDTDNFSLQDVVDPSSDNLTECFADAVPQYFDPDYVGSKDRLSNFRNYGDSQGGYGYLYNWYAADNRGLPPLGWHVPTITEFSTLSTELGGSTVAGGKMKEVGFTHWLSPNTDATNSSKFTLEGVGYRGGGGDFEGINTETRLWTSDGTPYYSEANYNTAVLLLNYFGGAQYGHAIRLIKDDSTDPGYLEDWEGNVYTTVKIGDQVWIKQNWGSAYINSGANRGDPLTKVTDSTTWGGAGTGDEYYCSYDNDDSYSIILPEDYLTIATSSLSYAYNGAAQTAKLIMTPIASTPTITDDQSWISTSYSSSTKLITITLTQNDGAARTGTVTVTHPVSTGLTDTISISQAKGYILSLSSTSMNFAFDELTPQTSTVTINPTSAEPTVSDNQTWLSAGFSSGSILVECTYNDTGNSRYGTVTVTHPNDGTVYATIDIEQYADNV